MVGHSFARFKTAIYLCGLVGFAIYTRAFLGDVADAYSTTFTYWDAVLELIGSGYVIFYWIIPFAAWEALRQLQASARPEDLIRYATRTDWAVAQGIRALPSILFFVGALLVVALVAALGFPFTWAWGPSSSNEGVLLQLPELARHQPLPILGVGLQIVALMATLLALTVVIAATATSLERPRLPAVTAMAVVMWAIASFRMDGWFSDVFGVPTYAVPWHSAATLPFGSGSGVMLLLVVGAAGYTLARLYELRRPRPAAIPPAAIAVAIGAVTLFALASTLPRHEEQPRSTMLMLLQGVGVDGASLTHYLASVILVLVPAIFVQRDMVASLSGRRYPEMIRLASPARWYGRQFSDAALLCGGYGLAMAIWAALLVAARLRTLPDYDSLLLAGLWGLALLAQTLVVVVMLALGTVLARRVEGGAYACGAVLLLTWPLGTLSRWAPAGQASLARITAASQPASPLIEPWPLLVLGVWLIGLGAVTLILFNRTRGEIL